MFERPPTRGQRAALTMGWPWSREGAHARERPADCERVHLVGALIGVHRFDVHHVPHHLPRRSPSSDARALALHCSCSPCQPAALSRSHCRSLAARDGLQVSTPHGRPAWRPTRRRHACTSRLQTTRRRPCSVHRQRTLFVSIMPFAPSMARASDATRRAAATLCRLCRLTCACQAPADALRRQNTAHGAAALPALNVNMHGATWQTCCGAAADHPVTLGFACVCYGWPHQSDIADSRSHTLGGLAPKCINRASNAGHVCMKAKAAQEWPLA